MTITAKHLIDLTQATIRRRRVAGALAGIAVTVACSAFVVLLLDAMVALPEPLRVPALPLWLAGAALALLALAILASRWAPSIAQAARLAEQATGDEQRRLSTALALGQMPGELAAAGAARFAASLDASRLDTGLPRSRAGRWLTGLVTVLVIAGATHLLVPTLFPTVLPRFTDPRGDHPPFSLSRVELVSAPTRVRSGDAARIEAEISGPGAARGLELHAQSLAGGAVQTLTMFQVGAGRYAGELAGVTEPLKVWVAGGGTRSRYHQLAVDLVPVLVRMDVSLTAPRYARLDLERRSAKGGDLVELAALPGSTVQLMPSANRSLAAIIVRRDDVAAVRLPLRDGVATISDLAPGTWTVALEANDGIRNDAQPVLRITPRTDAPPRARIVQPGNDALATPRMQVPLAIEADDDLGLIHVVRATEYNQLPAPELIEVASDRRYRRARDLRLAELGVAPGDVITVSAIARDTRPEAQFSESDSRSIRIISEAEYNAMLLRRVRPDALERKYQPFTRELSELEKEMRELRQQQLPKDELDRKLAELAKRAGELKRRVKALKRDTPLFAIEPQLQKMLTEAAEALERDAAAGKPQERNEGQRLAQDLALITRLARAQGFAARLRQLIDAEQNATERMAPFAEHRRLSDSDRVRLRELATQEDTLAQALDEWENLAPKLADDLRYGPWARSDQPQAAAASSESADLLDELGQAVGQTGAADLKRRAAQAARGGDGVEAHRLAAQARDRLLALLPKSQSMGGVCQGEAMMRLRWGDGQGLGQCLSGLGLAASNGFGLGGAGAGGLGLFLGYGGDDLGGSMPSDNMDLYGPENLGELGGASGDSKDGVAAIAAAGSGEAREATAYQRAQRADTAGKRTALSPEQQRLVDEYYRRLEGTTP